MLYGAQSAPSRTGIIYGTMDILWSFLIMTDLIFWWLRCINLLIDFVCVVPFSFRLHLDPGYNNQLQPSVFLRLTYIIVSYTIIVGHLNIAVCKYVYGTGSPFLTASYALLPVLSYIFSARSPHSLYKEYSTHPSLTLWCDKKIKYVRRLPCFLQFWPLMVETRRRPWCHGAICMDDSWRFGYCIELFGAVPWNCWLTICVLYVIFVVDKSLHCRTSAKSTAYLVEMTIPLKSYCPFLYAIYQMHWTIVWRFWSCLRHIVTRRIVCIIDKLRRLLHDRVSQSVLSENFACCVCLLTKHYCHNSLKSDSCIFNWNISKKFNKNKRTWNGIN
jgi:hypothetical protein